MKVTDEEIYGPSRGSAGSVEDCGGGFVRVHPVHHWKIAGKLVDDWGRQQSDRDFGAYPEG